MELDPSFRAASANGNSSNGQLAFANGTPPAGDISAPPPTGSSQDQAKTTLWMGELEPWMDENFIKGVFLSASGETVNVKVIRDKNSGNAGYCFVEFQTADAATKALGLNGNPVPNSSRQFKLNWASGGGLVDRRYVAANHTEQYFPHFPLFAHYTTFSFSGRSCAPTHIVLRPTLYPSHIHLHLARAVSLGQANAPFATRIPFSTTHHSP